MRWIGPWLFALALAGLAPAADARRDPLPPAVRDALAQAGVPPEAFGAFAAPLHAWSRRWEVDADRPMQPGSTMKLVTSVVALERVGPNLRGRTELLATGPVEGDVLRGDLVLRGGADAELGWAQLWQMLDELRDSGVREIAGDWILDRSLFTPSRLDTGRPPFDEWPEWPYNAIPDALNLKGSLMGLEIRADGETVTARTLPRLDGIEVQAGFTLVEGRCADWSNGWQPAQLRQSGSTTVVELRGTFPRGCTARPALQLLDRDRLAEATLRTLWARLGGTLAGSVREGVAPAEARVLVRRSARPWGELLRPLNKQSDNLLTRLLYLQLGAWGQAQPGAPAAGSTLEAADREVRRWFAERGIATAGMVLDNGSGLSRSERLTARQLATMLRHALNGPNAADLVMSLPTVAVDGTMRNRLKSSPAAGWARLKTGTLRNVTALAGIVHDDQRRPWVVAVMVNHDNARLARPALDALVDHIARGQRLPQPWPRAGREP